MPEPGLPVPIEEQEDTFLRNIHRLFFRPKVYFEGITSPKKKGWLFVFALTFGLASAIGRARDEAGSITGQEGWTWAEHWAYIAASGLIIMVIVYFIGELWYEFRLGVCGSPQKDKKLVRLVYLSSAQVVAIPMIIIEIVATLRFRDPAAAAAGGPAWTGGLAIVFLIWSYAVSYIGVRTVFKVRRLCAAIWFLILPIVFFVILIFVGVMAGLEDGLIRPSAPSVPKAEVSKPLEFSGLGLAFSYPGNWSVTDSGESPEVPAKVELQGEGGAYFLLQRAVNPDSAEAVADKWASNMTAALSMPTETKPFDSWGTIRGAGRRFEAVSGDVVNEYRLFVAPAAEGQLLMVCEAFPKAAGSRLEAGFKLIRKTFRTSGGAP